MTASRQGGGGRYIYIGGAQTSENYGNSRGLGPLRGPGGGSLRSLARQEGCEIDQVLGAAWVLLPSPSLFLQTLDPLPFRPQGGNFSGLAKYSYRAEGKIFGTVRRNLSGS